VSVQVSTHVPLLCSVGPASGVTAPTVPGAPVVGKVTVGRAKLGVPVVAGKAVTVMVNCSALPTALTGVSGVMGMVASTAFPCSLTPPWSWAALSVRSLLAGVKTACHWYVPAAVGR